MKKIICFALFLFSISCTEDVSVQDLFKEFTVSRDEVPADGQSTIDVSVVLSEETSSDRRKVIFKTSGGTFTVSNLEAQTVTAEFLDGKLTAKATIKVSATPGDFSISVQPEYDSSLQEFVLSKTIVATPSLATSVVLSSSSFGIAANYINEVQFTGILKNEFNKPVSSGNKVRFDDFLLDGSPANGEFRELKTTTGNTSTVSCYYSTGQYPIGTQIEIRCTLLDALEQPTTNTDSIILTVNQ